MSKRATSKKRATGDEDGAPKSATGPAKKKVWTAEQSAEVMRRLTEQDTSKDKKNPAMEKIKTDLLHNIIFFMENVGLWLERIREVEASVAPPPYVILLQRGLVTPSMELKEGVDATALPVPSSSSAAAATTAKSGATANDDDAAPSAEGGMGAPATSTVEGTEAEDQLTRKPTVAPRSNFQKVQLTEAQITEALALLKKYQPLTRGEELQVEVVDAEAAEKEILAAKRAKLRKERRKANKSGGRIVSAGANGAQGDEDDSSSAEDEEELTEVIAEKDENPDEGSADMPSFPDNANLLKEIAKARLFAYELITVFDGIADWIALNIPNLLDERASVTSEIMGAVAEQCQSLTEPLKRCCDLQLKYLEQRNEFEKDVVRYPNSVSLRDCFLSFEVDSWNDIASRWRIFIRCITILHTVLARNMKHLTQQALAADDGGASAMFM